MSIRQELSHGFHSRSAVWEELLTSKSNRGNDHLFAFVCSNSNSNSNSKLNTTTFTDAMTTAKAEEAVPEDALVLVHPDSCKFMRSKSSHTLREKKNLSLDLEGKSRSLSFHTVEEYDALLERIHGTRSLEDYFPWDGDNDFQGSTCVAEDQNEEDNEDSAVMVMEEEGKLEMGWKRKAIAKGLKSLDIEFPAATGIGKLKQQMLVQGQVYSPGTYVTPKFGSYNDPATHSQQKQSQGDKDKDEEETLFSPELLAAFEDCMQQLQLEEDTILRHMDHLVPNPTIM